MNIVILSGRFTRDPEIRYTQSGKAVTSFTLAVGEKESVEFIDCVAWEKRAEFVSKYFKKGDGANISGKLQIRTYEDKEGKKRKVAEVIVNSVEFPQGKKKEETFTELADTEDDLPF